jgi:glycosyltransferase involved in cell wall biosynthesis
MTAAAPVALNRPTPLRVLVALPSQGVYGGMELFALALADWLSRQPGYEVRLCFKIVAGFDVRPELRERCAELGLRAAFCRKGSLVLLDCIRWAELVHANNCSPDIGLVARLLDKPLVVTVHHWRRRQASLRNRLWRWVHDAADYRIYNSAFVMNTWLAGRPLPDSRVIPPVVHFGGVPVPPQARRGFFFIARWIEGKGIPQLLQAYRMARIDKAAWPLVLAGDGPLRAQFGGQIDASAADSISAPGFVTEVEKYRLMAHAKWLVCPPQTDEDLGLTPIEARALGVPSIVTVDGGLPEAAGPYAIFAPRADPAALARALELAAGLPDEVYAARAGAAKDSLADYVQPLSVYPDIYRTVLQRRGGVRAQGRA